MDEELDLITFEDEEGREVTLEVIDYMNYEGDQYVFLAEYDEDAEADGEPRQGFVMQVVPVEGDDDNEEFVPIDEKLAATLIDIFRNTSYLEEDEEE